MTCRSKCFRSSLHVEVLNCRNSVRKSMAKRISNEPIACDAREKRKRDPTFTSSEKLALIELVENHFNVVECKKTDAVTMRQKTDEWRKIETEFNATSSIHPRDWTVLKNCWENLKKRAKQELTQRNQHFMGTGGGPPKKKNEDPVIEYVMEIVQPRVSGYINVNDSDSTNIASSCCEVVAGQSQTHSHLCPIIITSDAGDTPQQETEIAATETVDWSQHTPRMLRDAMHHSLRPPSLSHIEDEHAHEQQPPSSTALPDFTATQLHPVVTPRVQHHAPPETTRSRPTTSTSRRRPTLTRDGAAETLSAHRIATLAIANSQAEEEHNIRMRILMLQEEQEKEKLKQESLKVKQEEAKLEIIMLELRKIKE